VKLFTPRFDEEDWYGLLSALPHTIESSSLYETVHALTGTATPKVNRFKDKEWSDFYMPLRRGRKVIAVPIGVTEVPQCEDKLVVSVGNRIPIHLSKGQETISPEYLTPFQEMGKLIPFIRRDHSLVEKIVPYDIRTGKIPGKYVLEELMPKEEKERILKSYYNHCDKNLAIEAVSLEEYLATAAICYKAAFSEETEGLAPAEMYRRWSYQPNIDAFSIKNPKSKKEFSQKQQSTEWQGSHLFWLTPSRIHLYPPGKGKPYFSLTAGLSGDESDFIRVVQSLVEKEIPFQTEHLGGVLEYLAGNTDFRVNLHCKYFPSIDYSHSPEQQLKYFPHIIWDQLKIPKWKTE